MYIYEHLGNNESNFEQMSPNSIGTSLTQSFEHTRTHTRAHTHATQTTRDPRPPAARETQQAKVKTH